MQWFYNLKISFKLILGFITVALIAGVVGILGINYIHQIDTADTEMYTDNTVPLSQLGVVIEKYQRIRVNHRDLALNLDLEEKKESISKIEDFEKDMFENLEHYGKTVETDADRQLYNKLTNLLTQQFKPLTQKVINLSLAHKEKEIPDLLYGEGATMNKEIQAVIDELFKFNVSDAKTKADQNTKIANTASTTMVIIIVVAMVLAIGLGLFISRTISNPVKHLVDAAEQLAVGDVNVKITAVTKDEIGHLMDSFGKMVENIKEQAEIAEKIAAGDLTVEVRVKSEKDLLGQKLQEMVQTNNEILNNISTASDQVAAGAKQVSVSSQALSQGSTEQASSIEEITNTVTHIANQIRQNASNANKANELAEAAKDLAMQGNNQMSGMLGAMQQINDSSSNISKIIKVIDEIAFQTNILALNAAVEAARAGQHGKGFAVVAEEVRNLAARSANAAKETTELIESSIKRVEAGTGIANDTAAALTKIVSGVTEVAQLVEEIASASNEQATGISQVNQAIGQVSQVVQANSATAEESASASEELSSQAGLLKDMVRKFKLKKVSDFYHGQSAFFGGAGVNSGLLASNQNSGMFLQDDSGAVTDRKIVLDQEFGKY